MPSDLQEHCYGCAGFAPATSWMPARIGLSNVRKCSEQISYSPFSLRPCVRALGLRMGDGAAPAGEGKSVENMYAETRKQLVLKYKGYLEVLLLSSPPG